MSRSDAPRTRPLSMFGQATAATPLAWAEVDAALRSAATFWVVAATTGVPHPRPVWGVWDGTSVWLSLGSPVLRRQLPSDAPVVVHLDSGLDVVIVEGVVTGAATEPATVAAYDEKYDWSYDVDRYGPFTEVVAHDVLAWRASGPAGRDGFTEVGAWRFDGAD